MHLLWLLVLAHFIGDFALQTDKIYFYKTTYKWGVSVHVAVCMGVKLLLLLPFLHVPRVWIFLGILAVLHIFIDHGKIVLATRFGPDNVWYFLVDQGLHLGSIVVLSWLLFNFNNPEPLPQFAGYLRLLEIPIVVRVTGLVIATFTGAPLIYYIRYQIESKKKPAVEYNFPPFRNRITGYLERFIATAGIITGGWYLLLLLIFLPRALFKNINGGNYLLRTRRPDFKSAASVAPADANLQSGYILVETMTGIVLCSIVGMAVRLYANAGLPI